MAFFQIDNAENDAIDMHEFGLVFSHAAIGIVVSDEQGIIIDINKYVESQFGYERNELLGKRIEILVPKEYHFLHKNDRRDFYAHPMPRQMGEGRNLLAVRKDGSMFSVEISLSPYIFNKETYVIAFIVNITRRKNDEDLVFQQKNELKNLTDKIATLNMDLERKVEERTRMLKSTLSQLEQSKKEISDALENEKQMGKLKS